MRSLFQSNDQSHHHRRNTTMSRTLVCAFVHIVFSTKHQESLITPDLQDGLHRYIGAVCRSCECPVLAVGGTEDHIHIACEFSRSTSVATIAQEVKEVSLKWMRD